MSKKYREDFNREVPKTEEVIAPVAEETEDPIVEEAVEEPAVEGVDAEPEPVVAKEEPVTVEGTITGVNTALNIRRKPEVKPNNQIGIAGKGTKIIVVDPDHPVKNDGEEWYKVFFGKEPGYAMKKYIVVK